MPDLPGFALVFIALVAGILALLGAVWFGLFVIAPIITRALDRAEADEEAGDRPD